jgi:hypothetical protein
LLTYSQAGPPAAPKMSILPVIILNSDKKFINRENHNNSTKFY